VQLAGDSLAAVAGARLWHDEVMTLVIAHRGASHQKPENTIEAFEQAVALGSDGVELDVRRSGDDRLVVHHDARLADHRVIRTETDLTSTIPTLADALDACEGVFVNIEIKNDPSEPDFDPTDWVAHAVGVELQRRTADTRWLISSFRAETVDLCRILLPRVRTALLTEDLGPAEIQRTVAGGHVAVHPSVDGLTEAAIRMAHGRGLAVNAWTCDEPDRIRELMSWGIDGICTNVPDVALAIRREFVG
jgi:glycerophosphoryl diester phosphodiesterase